MLCSIIIIKIKKMILNELKEWINTLTEEELKGNIAYFNETCGFSGFCTKIAEIDEDLYFVEIDDELTFMTRSQLLEDSSETFSEEEIAYMSPDLYVGDYLILE